MMRGTFAELALLLALVLGLVLPLQAFASHTAGASEEVHLATLGRSAFEVSQGLPLPAPVPSLSVAQ